MHDELEGGWFWALVVWLGWVFLLPFAFIAWLAPGPDTREKKEE